MDEKDIAKAKKTIQDTGTVFFLAFTQSKPKIPMAINSLKSVQTHTNTPLFLMICSHMHFCVESLLISDSHSPFFLFYITFVCQALWIFLLWTFQYILTGAFSIWTDSKRGKCKALHPLLNNITTWEASTRHLHFMASVSPFGKQSHTKLLDSEASNWQVLATWIVMQNVAFGNTSLKK